MSYDLKHFKTPFSVTDEVGRFLKQYKETEGGYEIVWHGDDWEKITDDKAAAEGWQEFLKSQHIKEHDLEGPEFDVAILKDKVAQDLVHSHKVFITQEEGEKRLKSWVEGEKGAIEKLVHKINPKIEVEVSTPDTGSYYGSNAYGAGITLTLDGESEEIEPSGYYYTYDEGATIGDAAMSWDWAAWLGIEESPFYDQDWADAYSYDNATQWFSEAGSIEGSEHDIEHAAKKLVEYTVEASLNGMKIGQSKVVTSGWGYKFKNKAEQIKALTEYINDMAESRINNEGGADWEEYKERGVSEVDDQLSGLSGKVNGKEVHDVFYALMEGLTDEEMKKVAKGLKHSYWAPGDDWHYIGV